MLINKKYRSYRLFKQKDMNEKTCKNKIMFKKLVGRQV